jgi:hypothetical protein
MFQQQTLLKSNTAKAHMQYVCALYAINSASACRGRKMQMESAATSASLAQLAPAAFGATWAKQMHNTYV